MVSVFDDLITAARRGDWGRVDSELVPKLRDVIATSLTVLDITDRAVFEKTVKAMIDMAIKDEEKFPAGRAVMFLWSHRDDGILKDEIREGIEKFRARPEIAEWKKDLLENIPDVTELLK